MDIFNEENDIMDQVMIFHFNMLAGKECSIEKKILIFRVIEFVESERHGLQIPLTSTGVRVVTLLGINYSSVHCLKIQLEELRQQTAMEAGSEDEMMNIERPKPPQYLPLLVTEKRKTFGQQKNLPHVLLEKFQSRSHRGKKKMSDDDE